MPFRANDAAQAGLERARSTLTRGLPVKDRAACLRTLDALVARHGPVVDTYPSWHPLLRGAGAGDTPITTPGVESGYHGLDHNVYFVNAFLTAPYDNADRVIDSVNDPPSDWACDVVRIRTERVRGPIYAPGTAPVLVRCDWKRGPDATHSIPMSLAVPLLLETELADWHRAEVGETWETMRPYFLGSPGGKRSSLFVDQETGQQLKRLWTLLNDSAVFGPVKQR